MVSIAEATENAIKFAREALGEGRTAGVRLEEVESTAADGAAAWLITLSMTGGSSSMNYALGQIKREYKTFTVLKGNGEVTSMKIRELADA